MVTADDSYSCGVVYIASGKSYYAEAAASAKSLRKISPGIPISIITDQSEKSDCFDTQLSLKNPQYNFFDKINALKQSPYHRTLFLDTDTIILKDLGDCFKLLDRFELAVAHEPARFLYPLGDVPDAFPELNTGVVLYKKSEKFERFINSWLKLYEEENERKRKAGIPLWHDQLSFTKAIWKSNLSIFIFPPEWNYRAPFPQFVCGPITIFHGRLKNQQSDVSFVNTKQDGRLLNPNPQRLFEIIRNTWNLFRILKRK